MFIIYEIFNQRNSIDYQTLFLIMLERKENTTLLKILQQSIANRAMRIETLEKLKLAHL